MKPVCPHVPQPVAVGLMALGILTDAACASAPSWYASSSFFEQSRFVDLTHAFGTDTIMWPTEQDFKLITQHAEDMPGGYFYVSNRQELPNTVAPISMDRFTFHEANGHLIRFPSND